MTACNRSNPRRGANAIEFALVLPILLAFLLGIMDYGWYFSRQAVVTNCVRDAARTGALTPQDDGPTAAASTRFTTCLTQNGINSGTPTVTSTFIGVAPDQTLQLVVGVPYSPITGFVPMPNALNGRMTMRMEDQPD